MPAPQLLPEIIENLSAVSLTDAASSDSFESSFEPLSSTKLMEARDSISSIDSDVSLSFDRTLTADETISNRPGKQQTDEDEGAHMADLSDSASDTASNGGGKDSGCEVTPEITEPPIFTPPSEELADKIVQQVEFYFSDANITKDAFLLKHVKRNKEGYVSLKLISSFKRVKHITKDWRVVAHALERSIKLEINEAGTKLRRLNALPQYDETTPSRTVVSVNMPIEKPTIENVAELFRSCGEIALIRILRPGNPIPADVRQFINKNPSLSGTVCALVEFVVSESARNAQQLYKQHPQLNVYELNCVPHPERKKKPNAKSNKHVYATSNSIRHHSIDSSDYTSSEAEDKLLRSSNKMRRGSSTSVSNRCMEPAAWLQRRLSASSTEASFMFVPRRLSYGSSSRESSESNLFIPRRVSACSLLSSTSSGSDSACQHYHHYQPATQYYHHHHHHQPYHPAAHAIMPIQAAVPLNPVAAAYYQRRMSACSLSSDCGTNMRSRSNSAAFQSGENVVRLPRGPDGSRGFQRRVLCE